MSVIRNLLFSAGIFFVVGSVVCYEELSEKDVSESSKEESVEKDLGTFPPEEREKLKKEIMKNQEENSEKFGLNLTSSPEQIETYLKKEEKEVGTKLPEIIEKGFTDGEDLKKFKNFFTLFKKIETEGNDEDVVEKSPAEMKEMKEESFRLVYKLRENEGMPKISQEEFDKEWNKKKEEYGKQFPRIVESGIIDLKALEKMESLTPVKVVSESITEVSTLVSEIVKEEAPKDAFVIRNAKQKICILAKFQADIVINYFGKTSEQKAEVTVPSGDIAKGNCGGPNQLPSMEISWGKFNFSLTFDKISDETWGLTYAELTYDTSGPLFDGARIRSKVIARSEEISMFETPFGKSYFCPAQEVILLHSGLQQVATVRMKEIHLQPYDVEDGNFSASHRCSKVVIDGPDEEPFVQDETIPLAVGCTLALITLLILVGFSVHRAYNAAKVDYNTME